MDRVFDGTAIVVLVWAGHLSLVYEYKKSFVDYIPKCDILGYSERMGCLSTYNVWCQRFVCYYCTDGISHSYRNTV